MLKIYDGGYQLTFGLSLKDLVSDNRYSATYSDDKVFNLGEFLATTVVISDTDSGDKQESLLATSNLKWGDPTTFGRIGLFNNKGNLPLNGCSFFVP